MVQREVRTGSMFPTHCMEALHAAGACHCMERTLAGGSHEIVAVEPERRRNVRTASERLARG
jgi:hypothetical protein